MPSLRLSMAVQRSAYEHGVPYPLAVALIERESAFDPHAAGPVDEIGLTQLRPSTAAELGVDARSPAQNIDGGMAYLSKQYDRFGSWKKALIAYNAGPSRVGNPPRSSLDYAEALVAAVPARYVVTLPPDCPAVGFDWALVFAVLSFGRLWRTIKGGCRPWTELG